DVDARVLDQALSVALAGRGWTLADLHRAVDDWRRGVSPPTVPMLIALEIISDACTGPARALTYTTDRGYVRGRHPCVIDTYSDAVMKLAGDCDDMTRVA